MTELFVILLAILLAAAAFAVFSRDRRRCPQCNRSCLRFRNCNERFDNHQGRLYLCRKHGLFLDREK
jgi:hypothetical protein